MHVIIIETILFYVSAPLCGKLVIRYGCRAVTVAGCLILFSGLVVTAFATSIFYVYFTFGIITGIILSNV